LVAVSSQSQSEEEIFSPITEKDSYCSTNSREGGPSTNQRARIMTKSAKMGRKRERTISAFSDDGISQVRIRYEKNPCILKVAGFSGIVLQWCSLAYPKYVKNIQSSTVHICGVPEGWVGGHYRFFC
jgi:hypothetical protein